jgi:glycosyltransferase involved in cell wall biosynthesis
MLNGKKIIVVMPAYNAAKTLRRTYDEIPHDVVDDVILVDDASEDRTVALARELGIHCLVHDRNAGYGANQKTCYRRALELGADVVVMLHPDYQYTPKLITAMAAMITSGVYHAVLGSRVLGRGALAGGMPVYKYVANRVLTFTQNIFLAQKLAEYHTGYRAFSREVLSTLPLDENSDDFVFDNEVIVQLIYFGYEVAEITCPAKYFDEASSINWWRSVWYGLAVLRTTLRYVAARAGFAPHATLRREGRRLSLAPEGAAAPSRRPGISVFPRVG